MPETHRTLILVAFAACYGLALSRKVKIAYASMGAAAVLVLGGALTPAAVIEEAIKWDVMGIYWGFMMVSFVFMKSRMPEHIADLLVDRVTVERNVIVSLCALTAFLSAFMENVGVVLMMAPVALAISRMMKSDLFPYMIGIAISSNVVTTLTMVADPPPIILALETGMKPLDFYVFHGKAGLGTITLVAVLAAMAVLLFQFRHMRRPVEVPPTPPPATAGASILFAGGVLGLLVGPQFGIRPGAVGLVAGLIALYMGRAELKHMLRDFDWNSFFFILGVFVVIHALQASGLLGEFAALVRRTGIDSPTAMLAFLIWSSVVLSSFIDNVPYSILMIPVCQDLAASFGIAPWPFLYGMLIGTGVGGNVLPVGATANVFACGILEREGIKVDLRRYLSISVPFSLVAVAVAHLLLQIVWL